MRAVNITEGQQKPLDYSYLYNVPVVTLPWHDFITKWQKYYLVFKFL